MWCRKWNWQFSEEAASGLCGHASNNLLANCFQRNSRTAKTAAAVAFNSVYCDFDLLTCFSFFRYLTLHLLQLMTPIWKCAVIYYVVSLITLFFFLHGFAPHDYVCEVQLYRSWTGARANWITSPNVPSSVLLSPSWRHNVITRWCPLFGALLFWCCVHEFINGTLWLVIHKLAAEAEPVQYESFGWLSGWTGSCCT